MKKIGVISALMAILMTTGCQKEFVPQKGELYCDVYCIMCGGKMGNDLESAWWAIKEKYEKELHWRLSEEKRPINDFVWRYDKRTLWLFDLYDKTNRYAGDVIIDSKGFYYNFYLID